MSYCEFWTYWVEAKQNSQHDNFVIIWNLYLLPSCKWKMKLIIWQNSKSQNRFWTLYIFIFTVFCRWGCVSGSTMCQGPKEDIHSSSRGFSIRKRRSGHYRIVIPEGLVQRHHPGVSAGSRTTEAADGTSREASGSFGSQCISVLFWGNENQWKLIFTPILLVIWFAWHDYHLWNNILLCLKDKYSCQPPPPPISFIFKNVTNIDLAWGF